MAPPNKTPLAAYSPHSPTANDAAPSEETVLELAAMQAITESLSTLPDATARKRVLRWASGHFSAQRAARPRPSRPQLTAAKAPEPELAGIAELISVPEHDPENLGTVFEGRPFQPIMPEVTRAQPPAVSVFHRLVRGLKKRTRKRRRR